MNETLAWSLTTIYHPCTWQAPSSEVNELIWAVSCRLQISPYCEPTSSLSRSSSFQLLKGPPRALWWCAPNSSPPSSPRAGPPFLHSPRKVSPKKQKRRNIKTRGKKTKVPVLAAVGKFLLHCCPHFLGYPQETLSLTPWCLSGWSVEKLAFLHTAPSQSFMTSQQFFDSQQLPCARMHVLRNLVPSQEFFCKLFTVADSSLYFDSSFSFRILESYRISY